MNLPTYSETDLQENYQQELSQTLIDGLSDNGWTVPQVPDKDALITDKAMPDGTIASLATYMPNGTLWYVVADNELVVKKAGILHKITTGVY